VAVACERRRPLTMGRPRTLTISEGPPLDAAAPRGDAELVVDAQHYHRIVRDGILKATLSLDIMTADFKAMLIPAAGSGGREE